MDVRVKLLQGGSLQSKIKNPPNTEVDLLVATTNAIKVLTSTGTYGLGKVHHVVLDEADTLLDDSFFPELVGPFLNRIPVKFYIYYLLIDSFQFLYLRLYIYVVE